MSPPAAAPPDALRTALRVERRRNGRRASLIGLLGISMFLAFDILFGELLDRPLWRGHLRLFVLVWCLNGGLYLLARSSDTATEHAGFAIPLIFMPFIFVIIRGFVDAVPERYDGPATFLHIVMLWLIVAVGLSLDRRQLALAAVVAAILGAAIQIHVAAPPEIVALCVMVTLLGAGTVAYASAQALALVGDVTTEHARRERLGRYFSPQVATLLADRTEDEASGEVREVTLL